MAKNRQIAENLVLLRMAVGAAGEDKNLASKRQLLMGGPPETPSAPVPAESAKPAQTTVTVTTVSVSEPSDETPVALPDEEDVAESALQEKHFKINYGDTGYSYDSIFGPYTEGAKSVTVRFCEAILLGSGGS